MNQPLPHRMFLLCYDTDKDRLDSSSVLVRGPLMRAAAVADLTIGGLLRDRDGKAERTPAAATAPSDAFLAEVLHEVPQDRPRRWFKVVESGWHTAEGAVRDQLASIGTITIDRRRALGLFPVRHITLAEPEQARALQDRVRNVVLSGHDPATVAIEDATLAALAADGDVGTVFTTRERITHRHAFRAVTDHVDTTLPGLRKALLWSIAARRSAAS